MAIPVAAIKRVERVQFELPLSKKEKEKLGTMTFNQFEIFLKDDFIDIYLRPEYDLRVTAMCPAHAHAHEKNPNTLSI
jgi:hypothetical protein